jgi:hypothetical protein
LSDTLFSPIGDPDQDLTADREEISRFCDALFRYAETGFVQFRTFRDKPESGTWGTPWEAADVTDLSSLIDKATRLATGAARAKPRIVFAPPVVVLKSPTSPKGWHCPWTAILTPCGLVRGSRSYSASRLAWCSREGNGPIPKPVRYRTRYICTGGYRSRRGRRKTMRF